MSTARSPLRVLKMQARKIAGVLKAAERGDMVANDPLGKVRAAREGEGIKFAVAMDDKMLTIEMSWAAIRDTSEVGITEFILKHMRDAREAVN
jgi:hypothetical protein